MLEMLLKVFFLEEGVDCGKGIRLGMGFWLEQLF